MARLLADEDFHRRAGNELIALGHDVLAAQTAGLRGLSDLDLLMWATMQGRAILTHNRRHFIRLHAMAQPRGGIIACTRNDADPAGLAGRVHVAIAGRTSLANQLIRVNRPAKPSPAP